MTPAGPEPTTITSYKVAARGFGGTGEAYTDAMNNDFKSGERNFRYMVQQVNTVFQRMDNDISHVKTLRSTIYTYKVP